MFNVVVTVPTAELMDDAARYGQVPALMAVAYKRNMTRLLRRYLPRLQVEPGAPPAGITRLMTPKQRRAFFATNGFGGGIPHQRTHAIAEGWQGEVDAFDAGGAATIFNDVAAVRWVEWYDQQPFLASMGWLYAPPILDDFMVEGAEVAGQTWYTVSDPFAGVPQT